MNKTNLRIIAAATAARLAEEARLEREKKKGQRDAERSSTATRPPKPSRSRR